MDLPKHLQGQDMKIDRPGGPSPPIQNVGYCEA
jgi:hypothetical protein